MGEKGLTYVGDRYKKERNEFLLQLSDNDIAVIENALKQVMNHGTNYMDMIQCREVLTKLQSMAIKDQTTTSNVFADGFRFDYDDHTDVK